MPDRLKKVILAAVIAVALAAAVSYGLISQQTADRIQSQADQTLSDDQSARASPPRPPNAPAPVPQTPDAGTQAPAGPASPNPAPTPRP